MPETLSQTTSCTFHAQRNCTIAHPSLWLAPLRGITVRTFRAVFSRAIREAGFIGAYAPFIPANPGLRVSDRLLADLEPFPASASAPRMSEPGLAQDEIREARMDCQLVPQVIGKDPASMRTMLRALKDRGFTRVDLNAGCPFPMIRRRGRGAALLRNPDLLEHMLEAGCEEMGPGNFSLKTRLGEHEPSELLAIIGRINRWPLAVLTVHARTAVQMYAGDPDLAAFGRVAEASSNPVMYNGDWPACNYDAYENDGGGEGRNHGEAKLRAVSVMVGRSFIRGLGERSDASDLLRAYTDRLSAELSGDQPVLGRLKELLSYWAEGAPRWRRLWPSVKICRRVSEFLSLV